MTSSRQNGYALLVMLLVISVGAVGLVVSARDPVTGAKANRSAEASTALARARDALLAYALADGYRNPGSSPSAKNVRPGSLPCPDGEDHPPDFSADLFDGAECPEYLGRLPHRTLDVPRIRDADGEPLWYALDPGFRDHDNAEPINPDKAGTLTINGSGSFAAVILSPGAPLEGQSRVATAAAEHYLESPNTDGDGDYADCRDDPECNDRVRGITVEQLFALVPQRLLGETETILRTFADDYDLYPWAAELGDPDGECAMGTFRGTLPVAVGNCAPSGYTFDPRRSGGGPIPDWIIDNGWYRYVYYAVAESCAGFNSTCAGDMLAFKGDSNRAIVIAWAGLPLASEAKGGLQDRGGTIPHHIREYLDSAENTNGDDVFDDPPNGSGENDILRAIPAH